MITVFKISHLNSCILDDDTLKNELKACLKNFNYKYSPLRLWIDRCEKNYIFYQRYFNSLAFEYYLRFGKKIKDGYKHIPLNKMNTSLPDNYFYNDNGVIKFIPFKDISLKNQEKLINYWKNNNVNWSGRFNNIEEAIKFMKGAEEC